jgi:hemoglobin
MRAIGWVCTAALAAALAGCGGGDGNGPRSADEPQAKRVNEAGETVTETGIGEEKPGEKVGTQDYVTLYDRIGGETGVRALVDDWVARAAADPRVNFERRGTKKPWEASPENVARLKEHLVQFLSVTTGGPNPQYTGRRMDEVHKGMKISNTEFDAMMDDLRASLTKVGVPVREQRELLRKVELTREQIVERRS